MKRLTFALLVLACAASRAFTQAETNLYIFNPKYPGAAFPSSSLISDAAGNFYGTAGNGNSSCGVQNDCGTVFELSPKSGGGWGVKVLHSFASNGNDGYQTTAALAFDSSGNLYGTTQLGGSHGGGVVFELLPKGAGSWTERVIYGFSRGNAAATGDYPYGGVVLDSLGNVYGTTSSGGTYNGGVAFELTPSAVGWTEKIIYNFGKPNARDAADPQASLVFDSGGNLYGTALSGTIFKLIPGGSGVWTEEVLYTFENNGSDGISPYGSLALDSQGNLYGTTLHGGGSGCHGYGCGTVFEVSPGAKGLWTETILHSFGSGADGSEPGAVTPIIDASGNLYGTTSAGGDYGYGTVFELSPGVGGVWTETLLHSFGQGKDGQSPAAGLIFDSAGNLYGTTVDGGAAGGGIAFEIAH
jgi:uncharacterized repeat protein (TIGR03803 family)